jgi:hypothetical protein
MYAYYTLSAIAVVYLIFAVLSLRYGKWYYLFIHPFAFICAEFILKYRYASEIHEVATYVDKVLAVGILLASLAFGLGYCVLKSKYIERITVFLNGQLNNENGISKRKFWCWTVFIIITIMLYYVCQYVRFGKFEYMFFQSYYHWHDLQEKLKESSFGMRATNWFITNFYLTMMFFALVLLFEVLKKRKHLYGITPIISAFIVSLIVMTSMFLLGYRTYPLYCVQCVYLLVVISFTHPSCRLSLIAVPLVFIIFIYCAFDAFYVVKIRHYGIYKIHERIVATMNSPKELENVRKRLFVIQDDVQAPKNVQFDLELKRTDIDNQHRDTIFPVDTPVEISLVGETTNQKQEIQTKKQIDEQEIKLKNELVYLRNKRYGHSLSQQTAWVMLYFGRHHQYLGVTYSLRGFLNRVLPPPFGKDKSFIGIGNMLDKMGTGNAIGPFGEGYASGGLICGYLYWIGWSFLCGLMAKAAMIFLFSFRQNDFETTAFGLCLFVFIPATITAGYSLMYQHVTSFFVILTCEFLVLRFIKFCYSKSVSTYIISI